MPLQQAMDVAIEKDLDLVKIAPGSNPPVCKIMDYGKFRFEQAKKDKEAKKNQHIVEIKEVRMSPGIGENDFNVKLKNAQKFLTDGDRVKVTVRFRGREMAHTNLGEELLRQFAEKCSEIAVLDDEEQREFLETLGLEEPGLNRLIREAYKLLGLQTYFTVGPKEARAWTIPVGATGPQAAGVIHTDFEKGFIRAETIAYADYVALKGEAGARDAGKMRAEGKSYVVKDGDVMHFLFNN